MPGRVLMLTHEFPPYPGGVARYCASVAAAASRSGYEVTVLAPGHGSQEAHDDDPPGVEVIRFAGNVFDIRNLRVLERVASPILNRNPWDIVHAADWPMTLVVGAHRLTNPRRIVSLHGSDIVVLRHSWRARWLGSFRRFGRFDRYVCNSHFSLSVLTRSFPKLPRSAITVAPLGVDDGWFEPPTADALRQLKNRVDFVDADRVVLTVARVDTRKGHLQTIEALARLPEALKSSVKYLCIGLCQDPQLARRIEAAARAQGVRLYLTGALPVAQVRAAYALASVFALTAEPMRKKVEGFGLVLLEAAAAGLPAVVTAVHGIPEVVSGAPGWICAPHDISDISNAFAAALTGERPAAARAACIRHAKQFSWARCVQLTYGEI